MTTITYAENLDIVWIDEEYQRLQEVLKNKENMPPRSQGKNKATRGQIYAIKNLHADGYNNKEIALALEVQQSLVWRILNNG